MKKSILLLTSVAAMIGFSPLCHAQSDAPYTEGPIWTITMVKAKYGMTAVMREADDRDTLLLGLVVTIELP